MAKKNYNTVATVELVTVLMEREISVPADTDRKEIIRLLREWDEKNPGATQPTLPTETVPPASAKDRTWVKVYQIGLENGVDFMFTTDVEPKFDGNGKPKHREGKQYHLINGEPVLLHNAVITHLRGLHYPRLQLKQGETGMPVKTQGSQDRYSVVPCEAPPTSKKVPALVAD